MMDSAQGLGKSAERRRHIIGGKGWGGLFLFCFLGALTALGLTTKILPFVPNGLTRLRVGIASRPAHARVLVAERKGTFVKAHLNVIVELCDDIARGANELSKGELEVFWSTTGSLPMLLSNAPKARAIMLLAASSNTDAIVTRDPAGQLAEKSILIVPDSPSYCALYDSIQELPEKLFQTTIRNLVKKPQTSAESLDYLQAHPDRAEAAGVWGPEVLLAEQPYRKLKILPSRGKVDDILVARDDFIRDQPKALQDFVSTLLSTPMDDRVEAAELLQTQTGYNQIADKAPIEALTKAFDWADLVANRRMFVSSGFERPYFDDLYGHAELAISKFVQLTPPDALRARASDGFFRNLYGVPPAPPPDNTCSSMWTETLHFVYFETKRSDIDDDQKRALERWAKSVEKYRSASTFCVEGHVDGVPSSEDSDLASQRIEAVKKYLMGKCGFELKEFHGTNYDSAKPADSRRTQSANTRNRRAVIFASH